MAQLGPYVLLEELGRGGMGVVHRAHDPRLDRAVAIKRLRPELGERELQRFEREARLTARLEHPSIAAVHEVVVQGEGAPYLVLQLVDGEPLDAVLRRDGPLAPRRAAEVVRAVAEAIAAAHGQGVVHRDLKPSNVILTPEGRPVVLDFGLAAPLTRESLALTVSADVVGTPAYMAPEQLVDPRRVGPPADVYGLGALLFEALTGRAPFEGATPLAIFDAVLRDDPSAPSQVRREVHRDLDAICLRCLEKEPRRRYAAAADLAQDLGRFLAGEPIVARPVSRFTRARRWVRRNPAPAALASLVVTVGAVGAGLAVRQRALAAAASRRQEEALATQRERLARDEARREAARAQLERGYALLALGRAREAAGRFAEAAASLGPSAGGDARDDAAEALRAAAARGAAEALAEGGRLPQAAGLARGESLACAVSDDGRLLATFGWGHLLVWDLQREARVTEIDIGALGLGGAHSEPVFLPGGEGLVCVLSPSGPANATLVRWDLPTGRERWRLPGEGGQARVSPDGRLVACGYTPAVRLLDAASGADVRRLEATARPHAAYSAGATDMDFSPDGREVAVGYDDGTVSVWDVGGGAHLRWLHAHPLGMRFVRFTPPGTFTAGAGLITGGVVGDVKVWDQPNADPRPAPARTLLAVESGQARCVTVTAGPDGALVAVGSDDGTCRVWHESGSLLGRFRALPPVGNARLASCAFTAGGRELVVATGQPGLARWRLNRARVVRGEGPVAFGGARADLAWVESRQHHAAVISVRARDGAAARAVEVPGHVRALALSADGDALAVAVHPTGAEGMLLRHDDAGEVLVHDAASGALRARLPLPSAGALRFDPAGRALLVGRHEPWFRNVHPPALVRRLAWSAGAPSAAGASVHAWHVAGITALACTPDGARLASASVDGTVGLWEVASLEVAAVVDVVRERVLRPDPSVRPDPADAPAFWSWWVSTMGDDERGKPWQSSQEDSARFAALDCAFSPDGRRLATASVDGVVRVWDVATWRCLQRLHGHEHAVVLCGFTADGRVVSAARDGTVHVWDGAMERVLRTCHAGAPLTHAALSPDGATLAAATDDRRVWLWDLRVDPVPGFDADPVAAVKAGLR